MPFSTPFNFRAACLMVILGLSLDAQVVVITSAKNPILKLTGDQLVQIFLGQSNTLPSGAMVEPLDLQPNSPLRKVFYEKFLGKSPAQIKSHWSKQGFSGMKQPPRTVGSSQDAVKLVAANPKYIAYVDQSAVNAGVKVLKVE